MNAHSPVSDAPAWLEWIDFIAGGTTPEQIVQFRPSAANQQRVADLVERGKSGLLSQAEASELEEFLQIEHLVIMAKAQARRHLSRGSAD